MSSKRHKEKGKSHINNIFENVNKAGRIILHPAFAIAPIFLGVVLSIVTTVKSSPGNFGIVEFIVNNKTCIWIGLGLWLLVAVMLTQNDRTVEELKQKIFEQKGQIEHTSFLLANKYGELARFSRMLLWEEVLREFVHANFEIDSCQLFSYTCSRKEQDVIVSVHYVTGYANEGVETNALLQSYFQFPLDIHEKFATIIQQCNALQSINSPADLPVAEDLLKKMLSLSDFLKNELLSIKKADDITPKHCIEYRLLLILITKIKRYSYHREDRVNGIERQNNSWLTWDMLSESGNILQSNKKSNVEKELERRKRTGILGCVLLQETFGFINCRSTGKSGRVYIGFPMVMFEKNMIVMFSMPKQTFDGTESLYQEIDKVKNDFIRRIYTKK